MSARRVVIAVVLGALVAGCATRTRVRYRGAVPPSCAATRSYLPGPAPAAPAARVP